MKISVIVPCRNEKFHIAALLDSILAQTLEPDWELEILIADGRSGDGTLTILQNYASQYSSIRIIDNPDQIVSTGLNAAILASSGDVIVRMDSHTVYAKDYLKECVHLLEETGADNVGGPWVAEGRGYVGKAIATAFRSLFCVGGGKAHDPSYTGEVDTVYLGCWRRSTLERAGLFDPNLVRNQDDELNFRLHRMGGRIWQSSAIKSVYTPRSSLAALFRQYLQYGYWKVAILRKYRTLASWRHAVPVLFVSSLITMLFMIGLAAILDRPAVLNFFGTALAIEFGIYVLACTAATLQFARSVEFKVLILLPVVIAIYHISYGLGFLTGILDPATFSIQRRPPPRAFTALTR